MILAAKLAAPILVVSLAIGFAVSLLQSVTQIQEVTLSFVPKLIGVGLRHPAHRQLDAAARPWTSPTTCSTIAARAAGRLTPGAAMSFQVPIEQVLAVLLVAHPGLGLARRRAAVQLPRDPQPGQGRRSPWRSRLPIAPRLVAQAPAPRCSRWSWPRCSRSSSASTLGFLAQLLFAAVQAAGELIDLFGGFTLATLYDPLSNVSSSMFGRFHQLIAVTLLFATNGHLFLLRGFMASYEVVPAAPDQHRRLLTQTVLAHVGTFFTSALQIAGAGGRGAVPGRARAGPGQPGGRRR